MYVIDPGSGSRGLGRLDGRRLSRRRSEEIDEGDDRRTKRRLRVHGMDRIVVSERYAVAEPDKACAIFQTFRARHSVHPTAPILPALTEREGAPLNVGLLCSTMPPDKVGTAPAICPVLRKKWKMSRTTFFCRAPL